MKKLLTVLALASSFGAFAQNSGMNVYISEFLHNDPSGGTSGDSLEFIELYNPNGVSVTLAGYSFVGVTYTFPAGSTIGANSYLVIAKDSAAIFRNFGVSALKWTSGGLNNTGEAIVLKSGSIIVDSLNYSATDWASVPGDDDNSQELCSPSSNHALYSSWLPGSTATGVIIGSKEIKATPGAANACTMPTPASYPYYPISQVTTNNANGAADSLNVTCELRAVVHSEDFRGDNSGGAAAGYDFALIDYTNTGIRVFSNFDINGYIPLRGDSIIARGTIGQFNGRTELDIDTLILVSTANPLVTPMLVSSPFTENIEGRLIRINNVVVVDTPTNTVTGMTVRFTNGADTFDVRIDADIDAFNYTFSADTFNIVGIGAQFDASSPFDSGYQIIPRDILDFEELGVVSVHNIKQTFAATLFPNPTSGRVNIQAAETVEMLIVTDVLGRNVAQLQPMSEQFSFDANWGAGLYNVTLISDKGQTTKRLVVNN